MSAPDYRAVASRLRAARARQQERRGNVATVPAAIELNPQFARALDLMEGSGAHLFITGRAGTGKSTLLEVFRKQTKKNVAVLAPTGVAAVNVRGQTIHSFFKFRPDVTVDAVRRRGAVRDGSALYRKLDAILIDEASMLRADLLDCVDAFLRVNGRNRGSPFGGIQMLFIGDLYQLPPVVAGGDERRFFTTTYETPYFFSARAFAGADVGVVELEKIYRQHDPAFIRLLNAVRNRTVTDKHLALLNRRVLPHAAPAAGDGFFIHLTPTNAMAAAENARRLGAFRSPVLAFDGTLQGDFDDRALPTNVHLRVKVGAQVMLVNNDRQGRWVNGTIGRIVERVHGRGDDADALLVELADGGVVDVGPYTWEMFRFVWNQGAGRLESEVVGSFTQYPLMLAWAVTIHKSQGKTFDRVVLDMGRGAFAHGQTYVALSRCTSLEGIVLKRPIQKKDIFLDWRVVKFLTQHQYAVSERALPLEQKLAAIRDAIQQQKCLHLTYLKASDEKSVRTVRPEEVGEMEYEGVTFLGLRGYCFERQDTRVFRVDRILELALAEAP